MAKEWILNHALNRFQLNFKRNVGPTSESIRKCAPKSLEEWREYYFNNVKPKEHIIELGKKLYIKITEVIQAEIAQITEQDCIDIMIDLVINRTYEGYITEIQTIYGHLQNLLHENIEPAPDEWDRKFNIDFYIKINNCYIGLQIKPVSTGGESQITEIYKEQYIQHKSHKQFEQEYKGKVFYIYSVKSGEKKIIANIEVVEEIKNEINRLKAL
jgi:hypothetical protein